MPLYTIKCPSCGEKEDIFRTVSARDSIPTCHCGGQPTRVISAPMLRKEFEPYVSPATGKLVSSWTQRKEEMTRAGYVTYEPGMKEDIARNKAAAEAKTMAKIEKSVDELVTSLNTSGKLENFNV